MKNLISVGRGGFGLADVEKMHVSLCVDAVLRHTQDAVSLRLGAVGDIGYCDVINSMHCQMWKQLLTNLWIENILSIGYRQPFRYHGRSKIVVTFIWPLPGHQGRTPCHFLIIVIKFPSVSLSNSSMGLTLTVHRHYDLRIIAWQTTDKQLTRNKAIAALKKGSTHCSAGTDGFCRDVYHVEAR